MRKKIIAGNWKMNKTYGEALLLANEVSDHVSKNNHPSLLTIIAPPFPFLTAVSRATDGTAGIAVAAQNCHTENAGAFTGEVSVPMIISCGAQYVIIGHSERRQYFGETDEMLLAKLRMALANGLKPIFCIGESLKERESGKHFETVATQLRNTVLKFDPTYLLQTIIAYEPVWAIGTGLTATPEQAQEMHAYIRKTLSDQFGAPAAGSVSILYGGSCNAANAAQLFSCADVDGGLIGGASLNALDFSAIRKAMVENLG
jgi:triosephosphate isomerase (TIM)